MHRPHHREVQYKAEAALFASMRRQQRKSGTTPTGLPSSGALWRSLRQQLMDTLQRFANERKLTLLETNEMLLRTPPPDLTMAERCWLESMRNLVSIMPRRRTTRSNSTISPHTRRSLSPVQDGR